MWTGGFVSIHCVRLLVLSNHRSFVDNLRYTFTSCVYGYPKSVSNISTQCTVNCQPLDRALEFDLTDPGANNFYTWCGTSSFADNGITKCEKCYNFTLIQTQDPTNGQSQVFMANCTLEPPSS